MAKPATVRTWATPLTIGAFLLMAATGILMFFGWNTGLTTVAHQWLSWFFLLSAGGHIAANWRPFRNHLKTGWAGSACCASRKAAAIGKAGAFSEPIVVRESLYATAARLRARSMSLGRPKAVSMACSSALSGT